MTVKSKKCIIYIIKSIDDQFKIFTKEEFTMAASRLIGDYPVIGIRPTIDGRRGYLRVRESLEDQTMNMAKAAAKRT